VKLFLIGLPGSGKSTLGKQISKLMNLPFIDLDEQIIAREGLPVSEIFGAKGQDYFRQVEAEVLREQIKQPEFVMATGGGTPVFFGNMELINQSGISFYLDTPISVIAARMDVNETSLRPLLAGVNEVGVETKLMSLFDARKSFYEQAHFTVKGDSITALEIIQLVEAKHG
jgi:shikimate kinase